MGNKGPDDLRGKRYDPDERLEREKERKKKEQQERELADLEDKISLKEALDKVRDAEKDVHEELPDDETTLQQDTEMLDRAEEEKRKRLEEEEEKARRRHDRPPPGRYDK